MTAKLAKQHQIETKVSQLNVTSFFENFEKFGVTIGRHFPVVSW